MQYYKNINNQIFAFELDGSQDSFIAKDLIPITEQEANELLDETKEKQFSALSYAQKRINEYPSVIEYIDGIVKGDKEQVQKYIDACLAVKAKYPKPE